MQAGADEFWGIGDNVNLGNMHSVSAPWRAWMRPFGAMGVAVAVGVFGMTGIRRTEGRAEAAPVRAPPGDTTARLRVVVLNRSPPPVVSISSTQILPIPMSSDALASTEMIPRGWP